MKYTLDWVVIMEQVDDGKWKCTVEYPKNYMQYYAVSVSQREALQAAVDRVVAVVTNEPLPTDFPQGGGA